MVICLMQNIVPSSTRKSFPFFHQNPERGPIAETGGSSLHLAIVGASSHGGSATFDRNFRPTPASQANRCKGRTCPLRAPPRAQSLPWAGGLAPIVPPHPQGPSRECRGTIATPALALDPACQLGPQDAQLAALGARSNAQVLRVP